MDFALQVSGTYDKVLDAAQWAEEQGLAAVALPDHYLMSTDAEIAKTKPAPDAFIQLAGLARETSTIELSVLVSPITFRHPAVLGKMAIELNRMSGGRFTLGVGTGWLDAEHEVFGLSYPDRSTRFEMMEDALAYLRAMLAPEPLGHAGSHYQLQAHPIAPAPVGRVPLVVGGTGKVRTPTLAGKYADELNAYPAPPDEYRHKVELARRIAAENGRHPEALLISSSGGLVTAPTEREYRDKLAKIAEETGRSIDEMEAHFAERATPRGTHEQVREMLADLEAAGVQRFYIQRVVDFDRAEEEALLDVLRG